MDDKRVLWLILWTFLSAYIGSFYLPATAHTIDRPKSSLYVIYVEPCRLALNVVWYWITIKFFNLKKDFVIRWLAIGVMFQFCLAVYLYLNLYDITPVPDTVAIYLSIYKGRQVLWFGETPLYRMAGTFDESPPFGLFMFSCFVIFMLSLRDRTVGAAKYRKWAIWGAVTSLLGAVASISDQVLIAVLIFGFVWYISERKNFANQSSTSRFAEVSLAFVLIVGICGFLGSRLLEKGQEAASYKATSTTDVEGTAGAERAFHLRYGMERFGEVPLAIWTGIGAGRYGDYAFRTGLFQPTVTIQNLPLTWVLEYGLFGVGIIWIWLTNVLRRGRSSYGAVAIAAFIGLLIAAISQGNWLWEGWFMALAFLYSVGCATTDDKLMSAPTHQRKSI